MFHRTYGETKNCKGCRYWSEMLAQAVGGSGVQAMCLSDGGALAGKYTSGHMTCDAWKPGHLGAVDDPPNYGEETRAAYAEEEREEAEANGQFGMGS